MDRHDLRAMKNIYVYQEADRRIPLHEKIGYVILALTFTSIWIFVISQ